MSARDYLRRALEDTGIVELRHQAGERWTSGRFNTLTDLEHAARSLADDGNLYTTLNRPADGRARNAMGDRPMRDDDIATICRLPFDIDPIRPTGTAATAEELAAAQRGRDLLVAVLAGYGWPMPALGMSGNGAHALYRTRIKSTPGWRQASAVLYAGVRAQRADTFEGLGVNLDVTMRNPGRIWRLYGTVNRKGEPTSDRPHRRAEVTLPRGAWQVIRAATIKRTVAALTPAVVRGPHRAPAPARIDGRGDYATLDAVRWFEAHGAYRRPLGGGKHAVDCPWSGEHTTVAPNGSDTVIWETSASGWATFHCSHAHCEGRTLRDVLALWGDADAHCTREWRRG